MEYSTDYNIKFRLMNAPKLLSFHYFICKFFLPSVVFGVVFRLYTHCAWKGGIKSAKNMKPQYCYKTVVCVCCYWAHSHTHRHTFCSTFIFYIYFQYFIYCIRWVFSSATPVVAVKLNRENKNCTILYLFTIRE